MLIFPKANPWTTIVFLTEIENDPRVHEISLGKINMGQNTQYQNALSWFLLLPGGV